VRLAALRAAGVVTGAEAEELARRARADELRELRVRDPPTSLEALRAAGIPPPPQPRESTHLPGFAPATAPAPREEGWVEGGSTAARNAIEALRTAGIPPPPPPQPRESVHLPGFAPARFRSSSPLHDGDAAALRERSAADARAEADLEG